MRTCTYFQGMIYIKQKGPPKARQVMCSWGHTKKEHTVKSSKTRIQAAALSLMAVVLLGKALWPMAAGPQQRLGSFAVEPTGRYLLDPKGKPFLNMIPLQNPTLRGLTRTVQNFFAHIWSTRHFLEVRRHF